MGKITTLTTIYLACVITLQTQLSIESTCMPGLLYSSHTQIRFPNFKITQLLWYYIRMGRASQDSRAAKPKLN